MGHWTIKLGIQTAGCNKSFQSLDFVLWPMEQSACLRSLISSWVKWFWVKCQSVLQQISRFILGIFYVFMIYVLNYCCCWYFFSLAKMPIIIQLHTESTESFDNAERYLCYLVEDQACIAWYSCEGWKIHREISKLKFAMDGWVDVSTVSGYISMHVSK